MSLLSSRLVAVAASAALLSGCGTGLYAHTYQQTGRSDGTSRDLETLALRNLHILPPASGDTHLPGSDAVLTGALVNKGEQADTLTSVTSPAAATVTLTQAGKPVSIVQIPAGGTAGEWTAVLTGVTEPLRAGTYVSVTLTFTSGGRTTLTVPVRLGDGQSGLEDREVHQEPYGH